jgi:RimJ/RimL family protein N-acetyltransferase
MLGVGWALLCVYFPDEQSACAVFRTYDYPAVDAVAHDFNEASRGLLGSLGFEEEGTIRRDRFIDGEYVDTYHYGLLREDWREGG